VPNHLAPAVTQMVWYKVGSIDEVPNKSGLAHYLEHLMFRGTTDIPPGEFSKILAAQGGNDNAFTTYDFTAFHETVASDRLAMIMQMEADRMQNLDIKVETATPELSVVLDERQERTDNNPQGKFEEQLGKTLFPNYPYGIPVIGWRSEIEKLTADDAKDFYKHHYAPNNVVVIISGDVSLDEVMRLAAATYGRLPRVDVTPRPIFPKLSEPTKNLIEVTDIRVQQPHLELHFVAPSYATQKGREAYALEVLNETLDGGEVGLLYRQLVVKEKLASGVDVDYDPDARGASSFSISLEPAPDIDIKVLEQALWHELKDLDRTGIDKKEIALAQSRLQRSAIFARDSLLAPGYVFGQALAIGHTVDDVEAWPDRIKAVTPQEVDTALHHLINSHDYVMGFLLPDPNATPEARAAASEPSHAHELGIR